MILTKTHADLIWKVLNQKKKHKAVSIDKTSLYRYCNMINVLNTIGLDDSEIAGYLISKYLVPGFMSDLVLPRTVSYSGTRKGTDFISSTYKAYNPADAGFVKHEEYNELLMKVSGADSIDECDMTINELLMEKPNAKVGKFNLALDPVTFEMFGGLFIATFKQSASEDKFEKVDDLKKYGSLDTFGNRLTPSNERCKPSDVKYFPIRSNYPLYLEAEYFEDSEDMFEDWFRACCDSLLTKPQ